MKKILPNQIISILEVLYFIFNNDTSNRFLPSYCIKKNGLDMTKKKNKIQKVTLNDTSLNLKFRLSDMGREWEYQVLSGILHEPTITKKIIKKLGPRTTFLDIGAATGYYTIIASKIIGESGEVISFEGDPKTFRRLSENIRLNNLRNVSLKNIYIGNNKEEQRLDNFLGKGNHPIFAKIDVEGEELNVLHGMEGLFKKGILEELIVEIHPYKLKDGGLQVFDFLKRKGGELELIFEEGRKEPYLSAKFTGENKPQKDLRKKYIKRIRKNNDKMGIKLF